MKTIHVVAAAIYNHNGELFITRRGADAHQGGKLEFPGGKVEAGETPYQALLRELKEEVGIAVTQARPLIKIEHRYHDKSVCLDVWHVDGFSGEAHGAEGQEGMWMAVESIEDADFPAANVAIIKAVKLPSMLMVSPDIESTEQVLEIQTSIQNYQRSLHKFERPLVYLRNTHLSPEKYAVMLKQVRERNVAIQWLAHGCKQEITTGRHYKSHELNALDRLPQTTRDKSTEWTSASIHSTEELKLAEAVGVDFVILGSLKATRTHAEVTELGWAQAEEIIAAATVPVYLIGGMTLADLQQAQAIGAQGIAGISLFK